MWSRHQPSTAAERALMRWLGPPALLIALGALAWQGCVTWKLERRARADAQAACVAAGLSEPECKTQVKQRGDDCWNRHYYPGRKGVKASFNEAGFRSCVLGAETPPLQ